MDIGAEEHPKDFFLREQFEKVLQTLKQEILPEDRIIAEAFLSSDEHLSDDDLLNMIAPEHPEIEATFVRRTLRLLCELGIAQPVLLGDLLVYEHLHLEQHHDHMVCVKCGRVEEFMVSHIEEEQLEACAKVGFQPLMHKLLINGVCAECVKETPPTRTLASCLPGGCEDSGGTRGQGTEAQASLHGTRSQNQGKDTDCRLVDVAAGAREPDRASACPGRQGDRGSAG